MLETILDDNYSVLVIRCEVRSSRELLHRYLEQHWAKLGVRSFQHTGLPCEESTYRQCYECDKWVEVEYHKGFEENNKDECYVGECDECRETILWEPNYVDDYESTRYGKRGNALIIGLALNGMKRKVHVNHTEVTNEEVGLCEEWLGKCESYKLSLAPEVRKVTTLEGGVKEVSEKLPFMSNQRISHLPNLVTWICKQVVFQ